MATHNFQIFDESMTDTMTDIDYQTDSQRTNGVIPGVANPLLHNKLYRQCSVMAYAIAQTIVARGYNADDSDPVALVNAIQRTFAFSVNGNVPNASGAVTAVRPIDAWPIGSIFITASSTNPATLLGGGTWTQIQGKYLLASSSSYTAGQSYGSMTKTLSVANLPSHTHGFTTGSAGSHSHTASTGSAGNHSHTRGSMDITGTVCGVNAGGAAGAFSRDSVRGGYINVDMTSHNDIAYWEFKASRSWTGETASAGNHTHTVTLANTGGSTAMSLVQPSQAVARWLRTA